MFRLARSLSITRVNLVWVVKIKLLCLKSVCTEKNVNSNYRATILRKIEFIINLIKIIKQKIFN